MQLLSRRALHNHNHLSLWQCRKDISNLSPPPLTHKMSSEPDRIQYTPRKFSPDLNVRHKRHPKGSNKKLRTLASRHHLNIGAVLRCRESNHISNNTRPVFVLIYLKIVSYNSAYNQAENLKSQTTESECHVAP